MLKKGDRVEVMTGPVREIEIEKDAEDFAFDRSEVGFWWDIVEEADDE